MNWEFEDYRQHKKPELGPWHTYIVPKIFVSDYLIKMFLWLWLLPFLIGFQITAIGLLFNTVLFDYIYYRYIKYVTSSGA